jgi:hypothetical protein
MTMRRTSSESHTRDPSSTKASDLPVLYALADMRRASSGRPDQAAVCAFSLASCITQRDAGPRTRSLWTVTSSCDPAIWAVPAGSTVMFLRAWPPDGTGPAGLSRVSGPRRPKGRQAA